MIGYLYGSGPAGACRTLSTNEDLGIKVATTIGNIFGQFFFGWLADLVGRKRMCELLSPLYSAKRGTDPMVLPQTALSS